MQEQRLKRKPEHQACNLISISPTVLPNAGFTQSRPRALDFPIDHHHKFKQSSNRSHNAQPKRIPKTNHHRGPRNRNGLRRTSPTPRKKHPLHQPARIQLPTQLRQQRLRNLAKLQPKNHRPRTLPGQKTLPQNVRHPPLALVGLLAPQPTSLRIALRIRTNLRRRPRPHRHARALQSLA
jgi:hypothetical protein